MTSPPFDSLALEIRDLRMLLEVSAPDGLTPGETREQIQRLKEVGDRMRLRRSVDEADFETVQRIAERVRLAARAELRAASARSQRLRTVGREATP